MKFFKPISESQLQASLQADKDNEYKASVSSAINDETLERIACDTAIVNSLAAETSNRVAADNALQNAFTDDINAEKSLRSTADAALQASIAAERTARINADTSLTDDFNAKLQTESDNRAAQFKSVGDALNAEVNQRQNAVVALTSAINQIQTQINNDATVKSALENEISARTGESASINSAIDGLRSLHNLDKAELQTAINTEKSARQSDVSVLQSSISAVDSGYKAADDALKSYVDGEISNLKSSDTAIWTALSDEVTLRSSQTSSLASALNAESVQRAGNFNSASNSISAINNALNAEIANRQNKDAQLQSSLETAVTNFNAAYKVFGGSTTEHAGTAGIVPPPPILEDSDTVYYLTNKGWGEPIEVDIKIGKVPSQAGTLTFNGQTQTPDWNDYDPLALEISGTTSASDAGTYTVYFQPRDGYKWTNGTRDKMSATYVINAYVVTIPTADVTSFEYTGNSITLNVVNFDSSGSTQTGVTSATAKGDYVARYELKNTKNYIFSDNTTAAKTISWHITVKSIDKPTISNVTFEYDGNSHAPTLTGFNAAWMTKSGVESSINAGNFTITVSLADKINTQWSTGGTADVTLNWVVNRKKLTAEQSAGFALTQNSFTFDDKNKAIYAYLTPTFNRDYYSLTGDSNKKYVGNYTVYVAPNSNYCFSDGSTTPVALNWSIVKAKLVKPYFEPSEFTYDGNSHNIFMTPSMTNTYLKKRNVTYLDESGDTVWRDVGNYTFYVKIKDDYVGQVEWEDGTADTVKVAVTWSVVKGDGLTKPTLSANSFEWTGGNISPTVNNFDSNTMTKSGSDTAVALGTYSITIALKDKVNTCWADSSTSDITLTYTVTKRTLTKPTLETSSYTYDGSAKTPAVNNFNSTYMEKTAASVNSATNADSYSIVVNLKDTSNCQWAGGGNGSVTLNWVINRKLLTAAQSSFSQSGTLTYNGSSQSVTISGYNSTYHDLSSETSAVNAGSYVAKVAPKVNYAFSDGSYNAKTVNWSVGKLSLTSPTLTNTSYTYDGNKHSPTINDYNSTYENISGTTDTATAGTYTVTFSLKDGNNTQFTGTTSTSVARTWTINKATPTLTLDTTSVTVDNDNRVKQIAITYDGDGVLSVASSDKDNAATASILSSNSILSIAGTGFHNCTVTVTAPETTNYTSATKSVSVTSKYIRALNLCDWTEIRNAIASGKAADYWNPGDTTPDFTVTFNGETVTTYATLLGINHNFALEANGKTNYADFIIAYTWYDSMYSGDFSTPVTSTGYFSMIYQGGNYSGNYAKFQDSVMRSRCNSFWAALPSDVKANFVVPTKYSNQYDSNNSYYGDTVDKVWILDVAELMGARGRCVQYDYFANGNHLYGGAVFWSRSTEVNSDGFFNVYLRSFQHNYTDSYDHSTGWYSLGFKPCFRIGA